LSSDYFIEHLDQSAKSTAEEIYLIFQESYTVESNLLGIANFPPLSRSVKNIRESKNHFWGCYKNSILAAVAEIELKDKLLDIHSFVVSPTFFRQGIGSKLLSAILDSELWKFAVVETGSANKPAILLYQKFGFIEEKEWITDEGIEKKK